MFDLDHLQEIWAALSKNRLRTLLTAFGVFWGIFLLVILLGSGQGLKNGVTQGFSGMATNSFFVWGQRTSKPFAGLPAGRRVQFTDQDTMILRRDLANAELVAPRLRLGGHRGGATATRGTESSAFNIMGDMPEILGIQSLLVDRGRFVNRIDVEEKRKVAVIGKRVVEVLFADGVAPVGETININGVAFQVVGTFRSRATGGNEERDAETIFIPFTTFQQAFNAIGRVHWFAVTAADRAPALEVQEKALSVLRARHKIAPDDRRGIGSFNLAEEYRKIQGLFTGIRLLMWIVGAGTLSAGAIGVSNIMLIVVRERTKELGLRRAVGATPWMVMSQVVFEAVLLTAVAGLLGMSAGVGVLELASRLVPVTGERQMFLNPGVHLFDAARAVVVLIGAGALAGMLPARRAVAVSPVVALRSE
jgi:putative ABC transport system permease protein